MTGTDTIFALSSGTGRSAVAVLRISGPAAAAIVVGMTGALPPPRELALRLVRNISTGEPLDRAMVAWLPAPRSFTGEDCAEFHLHGSPAVVSAVMGCLGMQPAVRPAEPGEFTRRAFINGKMDLVEVEGLGDLLEARTAGQRRQAFRQMAGLASSVFERWREQLLLVRADIEAVVDFADEPGVAEAAAPQIDARIDALVAEMSAALARSTSAEVVRDGVRVVLAGYPNTGKSSLLNALAQREAAIVSDIPGTTRDAIEVLLDLNGIPVLLTDTAGLRRDAADPVEKEGIRRSRERMSVADLLVWVSSPDQPGSETPDPGVVPDLVVANKSDLGSGLQRNDRHPLALSMSTRSGDGISTFLEQLTALLQSRFGDVESSLVVSQRQIGIVRESIRLLNEAQKTSDDRLELRAEEIRRASDEIGRLTGRIHVEEWLGAIFSRFCIGK